MYLIYNIFDDLSGPSYPLGQFPTKLYFVNLDFKKLVYMYIVLYV